MVDSVTSTESGQQSSSVFGGFSTETSVSSVESTATLTSLMSSVLEYASSETLSDTMTTVLSTSELGAQTTVLSESSTMSETVYSEPVTQTDVVLVTTGLDGTTGIVDVSITFSEKSSTIDLLPTTSLDAISSEVITSSVTVETTAVSSEETSTVLMEYTSTVATHESNTSSDM